jgi:hypothetical protein
MMLVETLMVMPIAGEFKVELCTKIKNWDLERFNNEGATLLRLLFLVIFMGLDRAIMFLQIRLEH